MLPKPLIQSPLLTHPPFTSSKCRAAYCPRAPGWFLAPSHTVCSFPHLGSSVPLTRRVRASSLSSKRKNAAVSDARGWGMFQYRLHRSKITLGHGVAFLCKVAHREELRSIAFQRKPQASSDLCLLKLQSFHDWFAANPLHYPGYFARATSREVQCDAPCTCMAAKLL